MKSHKIVFCDNYPKKPVETKNLKKIALKISREYPELTSKELNVIFCSDYIIRKLNRDYRKKDSVTDVLSFPFDTPDFLGEIYISIPRIEVQARRFGNTFEQELTRMFVHGIFHLLGYDHLTAKERDAMENLESKYNMQ